MSSKTEGGGGEGMGDKTSQNLGAQGLLEDRDTRSPIGKTGVGGGTRLPIIEEHTSFTKRAQNFEEFRDTNHLISPQEDGIRAQELP